MERYMFRGKRKDNSEWVYGYYISSPEFPFNDCKHFITEFIGIESSEPIFSWHEVIPGTVGMWTGMKDKNGIDIYEGDTYKNDTTEVLYQVMFINGAFVGGKDETSCSCISWGLDKNRKDTVKESTEWMIIVGNIHDNPELVNPAVKDSVTNTMYNTDPAAKATEELKEQATELESATQDQAMEVDSEEGNTEG